MARTRFPFQTIGWQRASVKLLSGGCIRYGCQSIKIAIIGSLTYLGSTVKVSHAFSQRAPIQLATAVTFLGTIYLDIFGIVDGCLRPEDTALFVIKFDRVVVYSMLDPDSFRSRLQITDHLSGKGMVDILSCINLAAERAHDVRSGDRVPPFASVPPGDRT